MSKRALVTLLVVLLVVEFSVALGVECSDILSHRYEGTGWICMGLAMTFTLAAVLMVVAARRQRGPCSSSYSAGRSTNPAAMRDLDRLTELAELQNLRERSDRGW